MSNGVTSHHFMRWLRSVASRRASMIDLAVIDLAVVVPTAALVCTPQCL
jgi:hypothetical protein